MLRGRDGHLRIGPWRGDHRVAYLAPVSGTTLCSVDDLQRVVDVAVGRGYESAVTAALGPLEQAAFLTLGFEVRERLHLLARHLPADTSPAPPTGVRLRRARRGDHEAVLALDHRAFDPFWRLDHAGLADALGATPSARFRVATDQGGGIAGYSIVGRASHRGYIQRLAVSPTCQGAGVGRVLLLDGIRWLDRRRVRRVLVNTQEANDAALGLYERAGFERQPGGLAVLAMSLGADPCAEPCGDA